MKPLPLILLVMLGAGGPASASRPLDPAPGDVAPDSVTPYFVLESTLSVGNKGEERLDVSVEPTCGEAVWLFDHAELMVTRNRFGDVQFVRIPEPGCTRCGPIVLRWFHEPTGYLAFEVHVFRRLQMLPCAAAHGASSGSG